MHKKASLFRPFTLAALCAGVVIFLSACGGAEPIPGPPAHRPSGLAGSSSVEAENAFAVARLLWKDSDTVCSDPQKALDNLNRALAIDPNYPEAYIRRGLAKSDLYDWDGAFEDLTQAILLAPIAESYAFRGYIGLRGGARVGARRDLMHSLELDKDQHRAWNFLGELDRISGDLDSACKNFQQGCKNGDCKPWDLAVENKDCK